MTKVWFRFSRMASSGEKLNFRWEKLSHRRYEEFLDFVMKYFVKHELMHTAAGISKNPEAMQEYRDILSQNYKDESHHTSILCLDNNTSDMVGFDSLKLYRKGEIYVDFRPAHTQEVKKFYRINCTLDSLCAVPDIVDKYRVHRFFDDAFVAFHPDFRGYKISSEVSLLRKHVCKANDVPLTGAWVTAIGTDRGSKDWETVYEISPSELEKILELKFQKPPPVVKYKVIKVD